MGLRAWVIAAAIAWACPAYSETPAEARERQGAWNTGAHIGEAAVLVETCPTSLKMSPIATAIRDEMLNQEQLRAHFEAGYARGMAMTKKFKERVEAARIPADVLCAYGLKRYGVDGGEVPGLLLELVEK